MQMSNQTEKVVTNVTTRLSELPAKATQAQIVEKINEIVAKVNSIKVRDRGPKSERQMTDEDAIRIRFGDLKDKNHKEAAAELGLSYGQIYSARNGYTFQHVEDPAKASAAKDSK